jgi:hypothetical protein
MLPKPGAQDLELGHPATNDSEAGRALGRAAAGTSGHDQRRTRSSAATLPASRCWSPAGRTRQANSLAEWRASAAQGLGRTAAPSGPLSGSYISSRKPIARQPVRRCIHSLELGCNPVVPLFGFPRGVGGPGRRHEKLRPFSQEGFGNAVLRRCFFAPTRPPLLKTIN